jgi:hypothetical protein
MEHHFQKSDSGAERARKYQVGTCFLAVRKEKGGKLMAGNLWWEINGGKLLAGKI